MPLKRRNRLTKLMFRAIEDDDVFRVEDLLRKRRVNLRARNKCGMTFLHANAVKGSSAITRRLINAGCEIDATWYGNTPLHEAIDNRNVSAGRCLILAGADLSVEGGFCQSSLHMAVRRVENRELVRLLIEAGLDVNARNNEGDAPLHIACRQGNESMVDLLLELGADIHAGDENGDTPMHLAALCSLWQGNLGIFETLLERGCGVDAPENTAGKTPFHCLLQGDNLDAIRFFLQNGADVKNRSRCCGKNALHIAAANPNAEVLRLILEQDVDLEQEDRYEMTALHCAVYAYLPANVRQLAARGADLNATDSDKIPAIETVMCGIFSVYFDDDVIENDRPNIQEERFRTLRLLLELGAELDRAEDWTKLDKAIMAYEEPRVANVIVEHFALQDELQRKKQAWLSQIHEFEMEMYEEVTLHYENCRTELSSTRDQKISGTSVSFWSLLTDELDVVARYARNSELVEAFERSDYQTKFPIYSGSLRDKLNEGLEHQKLIKSAAIVLSDTLEFVDPFHIAIKTIQDFLSLAEIKMLLGKVSQ